jgi:FlaA1/EpsC-like NDP-sugar epimerase
MPLKVGLHLVVFAAVFALSYSLRFDGVPPPDELRTLLQVLPWLVLVKLAVFGSRGSLQGWWRYATFADVVRLGESATLATVLLVAAGHFLQFGTTVPRSVVAADWAGTILVLGSIRSATRLLRERYYPMLVDRKAERVLILSASDAGLMLARLIQSRPELGFTVVGALDPDPRLQGQLLGAIRVLGRPDDVTRVAAAHGVKTVLVPTPAVDVRSNRALVERAKGAGLRVQVVPGFDALLKGAVTVQPRDVDIDDLLCREPVEFDSSSVSALVEGKCVLVTGAAGSIGAEVCRQLLAYRPARLVLLDHNENGLFFIERELKARAGATELVPRVASVTDAVRVRSAFRRHRPAVVIHAAAHKHVPVMEANPGEAVRNNVFGTRVVVDEAIRAGAESFVMISTDKAVNATSVMGACKRLAEMYVQARAGKSPTRLVTVRFGNVLGSAGSVVPIFKEQIRRGGPVTVTHPDMTRYFMTIPEASRLVLEACALGRGGEIFVLDMGEPVRIVDLARDMIRLSGLTEGRHIKIEFTGLRPGEKLYEELYHGEEEPLPTPHPKILIARHRHVTRHRVEAALRDLERAIYQPPAAVIAALRAAVPDYQPVRPLDEEPIPAASVRPGGPFETRPETMPAGFSEDDLPCEPRGRLRQTRLRGPPLPGRNRQSVDRYVTRHAGSSCE